MCHCHTAPRVWRAWTSVVTELGTTSWHRGTMRHCHNRLVQIALRLRGLYNSESLRLSEILQTLLSGQYCYFIT